jgi:putative DNA methylase
MTVKTRKKLIEVALPLDAINAASSREKSIRHGHPSTLHLWWARRPLATARAVIFAQMVDDPSSHPEIFPTEEDQEKERQRLFRIIEELVLWENTTNEEILQRARDEIWKSWRSTCADNADHSQAQELFNPDKLPAFHDPFAGGGALPLEAQRLGLESYASDLNPVAVLINKAMIEIPPKFAGKPPVNPEARSDKRLISREWKGAQGLAEDVRYYGQWMRDEAEKRIGHLYPKVEITAEMAADRADLKQYVGKPLTVIAWLWARTVKCPNPGCGCEMPLLSSCVLSSKAKKETYLNPIVEGGRIRFAVQSHKPDSIPDPSKGYKRGMSGIFGCAFCGTVTTRDYVAKEAVTKGLGSIQTAVVLGGNRARLYLPPEACGEPVEVPDSDTHGLEVELAPNPRDVWCRNFGLKRPVDLFTPRQLATETTFADLVEEAKVRVIRDAHVAGFADGNGSRRKEGISAAAYGDAVAVYLGLAVDKAVDYNTTLVTWSPGRDQAKSTFARQALPMVWDYAEVNPLAGAAGDFRVSLEGGVRLLERFVPAVSGSASLADASTQTISGAKVVSTDPPYYDNVGYADLSDFFYVWLRRSLRPTIPDLFATLKVPKTEELVAAPYRQGTKQKADAFFLAGMTQAMHRLAEQAHPGFPVTIYYAFKQSETDDEAGTASTGWDTFLEAVLQAGFMITGTWPVRTERSARSNSIGSNALASSIVLVCRRIEANDSIATRRELLAVLKAELPVALVNLQKANIAPVDLAQSAIGPGMAIYTRYSQVLDASGKLNSVGDALALINQTLDEVLAEQEGDYDADSRWALTWFEQVGFAEGEFGMAETLSKSKNTSVDGMQRAGIVKSGRGKVRLLRPDELDADWNPETDSRRTTWKAVHHLIRALESGGELAAAELVAKLGADAETARALCYRLYTIADRKKRAADALSYNGLVQAWPEISDRATKMGRAVTQAALQI